MFERLSGLTISLRCRNFATYLKDTEAERVVDKVVWRKL